MNAGSLPGCPPVRSAWYDRSSTSWLTQAKARGCLRIKGYLIVRRNQVRDYLDVAALADRYGITYAADVLRHIDTYYSDHRGPEPEGVATQLARQLANPKPADARTIGQLGRYKGLDARWTDWGNVTDVCRSLAVEMVQ